MTARFRRAVYFLVRRWLPVIRPVWRRLPAALRTRLASVLRPALNPGASASVRRAHALVPVGAPMSSLPTTSRRSPRGANPAISIVVPAHNDGLYLRNCLASVREQGFESWECLVIDDCSLDDSPDIAASFAHLDERFVLVRHDRNVGLAGTRNTGISRARAPYLAFLDADDFLFQDSLASRHEAAEAAVDPRVVGSWCDWVAVPEAARLDFVPPGGDKFGVVDYRSGKGSNQFISTSPLLRTDVVCSLGGFDDRFRTAEDFEFWTRLFRNGFALTGTGTIGVAYRQKRVSMVSADPFGHARNAAAVYDYMLRPLVDGAVSSLAIDPFSEPEPGIPGAGSRAERFVSFLTFAYLSGDPVQIRGIRELLAREDLAAVDVDEAIRRALARHSLRVGGVPNAERDRLRRVIVELLSDPVRSAAVDVSHEGVIDVSRVEPRTSKERPGSVPAAVRASRPFPPIKPWDVILSGASSTGVSELLALGREFVDAGASVAVLDPGRASVRHRAAHEGIRVLAHPTGPARLEISSDGLDRGVPAANRVVACAEPWLAEPAGSSDLVLARAGWEADLWREASDQVVVGGWRSRASGLETRGRPRDGDADRGRVETILVLRAPGHSDAPGREPLVGALGEDIDVVFGPHLSAPARDLVIAARIPIVAATVRAIVVSGSGIPVDALVHGTPVLVVDKKLPTPLDGVQTTSLDTLRAELAGVRTLDRDVVDEDWLKVQVAAIEPFLA